MTDYNIPTVTHSLCKTAQKQIINCFFSRGFYRVSTSQAQLALLVLFLLFLAT